MKAPPQAKATSIPALSKPIQRRAKSSEEISGVPPIVDEVLASPGQPLDPGTRASMESRFGHDFSQVKVHTDARAAESARAANALAYTVGQNMVFDSGQYAPHTAVGQKLIAHELTHAVQQQASTSPQATTAQAEAEADTASQSALGGQATAVQFSAPLAPAFKKKPGQKTDKIAVILVIGDRMQIQMESEKFYDYTVTKITVPPGSYTARNEKGLKIKGPKGEAIAGEILYKGTGVPDPTTLVFPANCPVIVMAQPQFVAGEGIEPEESQKISIPSEVSTSPPTSAPTPAETPSDVNAPEVSVEDAAQIEQLKAKGLIDASTAKDIQSKFEKQEPLTFEEAVQLVDALNRVVESGSKEESEKAQESWLKWAKLIEAHTGQISGKSGTSGKGLTPEAVKDILAKSKEFAGVKDAPAKTTEKVFHDPKLQKSWSGLKGWEKDLWKEYLKKYGATTSVLDSSSKDLQLTKAVRFSMALRLSTQYVNEGFRAAWEVMVNDPIFIGGTIVGIGAYLALWLMPEPVFSKAAAVLTTIGLMSLVAFSAQQIINLAKAWFRLEKESAEATTLTDLETAAQHFGESLGEAELQILVALASIIIGKLLPPPKPLPPPTGGGGLVGAGAGGSGVVMAETAAATSVKVLADGTIVIVGPATGMAMSMQGGKGDGSDVDEDAKTPVRQTAVVDEDVLTPTRQTPPENVRIPLSIPKTPGYNLRGLKTFSTSAETHHIAVVETPQGKAKALYLRTGGGTEPGETIPVDPKSGKQVLYGTEEGDWVPTHGVAKTTSFVKLIEEARPFGLTDTDIMPPPGNTPLPKLPSGNDSVQAIFQSKNVPLEQFGKSHWVIKPREGGVAIRPGPAAEWAENAKISLGLDKAASTVQGQVVNTAKAVNDWLRSLGVKVGGDYQVGEVLLDGTVITDIP
ncbi:MAG TPA: DUF4157 domain-containing protein [Anaerolineae bacterium]|nr:DUF4157 domain-containing protein [Anaerolineae bacterium]